MLFLDIADTDELGYFQSNVDFANELSRLGIQHFMVVQSSGGYVVQRNVM
jgi:hypothetical protein